MKKLVLISLAVLFVMGLAVSSDAVVKKKGMGKRAAMAACGADCGCCGSPMEKLKELGLDKKQKEAAEAIHLRTKKEMVRNRADVQVAEIELKEVLSKDPVDLKAAEAAVKKIEGVKSEMRMLHIKAREEMKANLTPEQKEKFISMTGMCSGMGMGMGMGRMGHGKGMMGGCDMHGMDDMEEMCPMCPGRHDGGTHPMRHGHN
jgi:Spy/CpxP family protein refolding chaperone